MIINRLVRQLSLVIIALLPLYYIRFEAAGLQTNLIEILVVLLLVFTFINYRRLSLPNIWPVGLILAGVILASFFALDAWVAFGIVKGWFIIPIIYYFCVVTTFPPDQRAVFIKPVLVGVILVSFYAVLQRLGLIPLLAHQLPEAQQYLNQGRTIGFFESPNFLAMYLVPLTVLTGGHLISTKNYRACWWLILPLAAILLSESQAGLLALVAGIIWLWLWRQTSLEAPSRIRLIAVVVGVLVILLALWRWTDNHERLYIWQKAWLMLREHLAIGIGPGQFQANFRLLDDQSGQFAQILPYALHPHNLFLNIWLSAGLLGITGFVWLLISQFREFGKNVARSPLVLAASAGVVAILAHGLFDSTYFKNDLAIIFWLLVFLTDNGYKKSNANRA